jgi:predicted nucleic-acid-binding protein
MDMAVAVKNELDEGNGHITVEVVAEMIYVLNKIYKIERHIIADNLQKLIEMDYTLIAEHKVVSYALSEFAATKLDFIDCLLIGYAKIKGCSIFTFDKALIKRLK